MTSEDPLISNPMMIIPHGYKSVKSISREVKCMNTFYKYQIHQIYFCACLHKNPIPHQTVKNPNGTQLHSIRSIINEN